MHHKLIVTEPALNDINHIFEYIAQDNPVAAKKLVDDFEQKFYILVKFPNSGFKPALAKSNVRVCVVAKNYQIIYQIDNEFIVIARILTRYQDVCFEL
jgi:addiction module RelE/StbE family toxin